MTVTPPPTAPGMPSGAEFGSSLIQRGWEAPEEVVFPRYIVDSPGLQAEDIGVLAHLLLRDPNQPSSVAALAVECQQRGWKITEYAMRSVVKRLKKAGHIHQDRVYSPATGRPDWVFTVYRNPANNQAYVNSASLEMPSSGRFVGSQRIGDADSLAPNESAAQADSLAANDTGPTRWLPTDRNPHVSAGRGRHVGSQRIGLHPPHPPEEEVTTSPSPKKRHSRGAEASPGGTTPTEPPVSTEQLQAAAAFLMRLPGPWAVGRLKAKNLGSELARAVAETGWDLDTSLKAWLTRKEDGKAAPRSHVVVLEYRVKNLELREAVFAAAAEPTSAPAASGIPDWCGQCNNGEKPRSLLMRTIADPDPASDRVDPCPRCHPSATRA